MRQEFQLRFCQHSTSSTASTPRVQVHDVRCYISHVQRLKESWPCAGLPNNPSYRETTRAVSSSFSLSKTGVCDSETRLHPQQVAWTQEG
ncbi:uncharacterized protein YALI1_A14483g [Yarrowia lipolytica]|uniref:Uncharacterized protein n=1 Tax=Yarrowia lipolytica TaxID=4952 RepID=A0A1D8N4T9_YARLL|nr:hypothetical protein YALI1_A14483g [Yarrowia lipolytica]